MFLCPQKLPRCLSARGKLAFAPDGCKGLFGFPGDFGAMGQDSICGTNVHLANYAKHIILCEKDLRFRAGCKRGLWAGRAACIRHVNAPTGVWGALEDSPQLNNNAIRPWLNV